MSMLNRLTLSTLLVGILLAGQTVEATTYYVDKLLPGSDSNPGTTETSPLLTIQAGINKASAPGDTVLVKNGTYSGMGQIVFKYSGTAGNPITLKNFPGHTPIIQFAGGPPNAVSDVTQRILVSSATGALRSVSYGIIEGLEITGAAIGIKLDNADHFIIRLNNIHGNGHGIFSNGAYLSTIERNQIWHNGQFNLCTTSPPACNQDHGMYLEGNWTIINNLVYDNLAYGLVMAGHPFNAAQQTDANHAGFNNGLVANNTFSYQRYRGGITMWDQDFSNTTVENNIFYENSQLDGSSSQGIDFTSCCGSGNLVRNNIWYSTGNSNGFTAGTGSGVSTSSNTSTNPLMINAPTTIPASPDFRLTSSSTAINAGLNLTANGITTDCIGKLRSSSGAWTLGAYEGALSSDTVPPNAPLGLTVH